jgi:hypothetical protein
LISADGLLSLWDVNFGEITHRASWNFQGKLAPPDPNNLTFNAQQVFLLPVNSSSSESNFLDPKKWADWVTVDIQVEFMADVKIFFFFCLKYFFFFFIQSPYAGERGIVFDILSPTEVKFFFKLMKKIFFFFYS